MRNRSTPARESKRSGSITKARVLGALHANMIKRLNGPDKKDGEGQRGRHPIACANREQDVHKDSRNNLHEVEGYKKCDGQ